MAGQRVRLTVKRGRVTHARQQAKRVRLQLTVIRLAPLWQLKLGKGCENGLLAQINLPNHRKAGALRHVQAYAINS